MDQIYENLDKYYVDDIEAGSLSKTAIDAMLKELDPYTVYYHESNIEDYQLMTTGQYGGIGALIRKTGDYTIISEPYEGNPAANAGIKAGDVILKIDDIDMKAKASDEVSKALKGPKGTIVKIEVQRHNDEQLTFEFERDEIKLKDVPYFGMLNEEIGYIKLSSFTQTASDEVKKAYHDLESQGMKKLIFDLRGNGGGLLREAVRIVNMFVPKNKLVVATKARVEEENRTYMTMEDPINLEIPVVMLINGTSASASEIVSGTLQDYDRAVIVGSTSYGKGLVQRTYDLDYGSKMKLTIAKYYTPSGRCVQRLDYYDHDDENKVEEIPDSLLQKFETSNGRTVIDGRGIEPDVTVEKDKFSRLTTMLYVENIIFDFATEYYYQHKEIAPASKFKLSNEDYNAFKEFVVSKDFSYSTESEEQLEELKKSIDKEGYTEETKNEIEELMKKVTPSKDRDLVKYRKEISQLLENEIVSRYYFQEGRAEHNFNEDLDVIEAIKILSDLTNYNTILGN